MAKTQKELPPSRVWNARQVAAFFGHSEQWFYANRKTLELYRFPRRSPLIDGWDSLAIRRWMDEKSNLIDSTTNDFSNIQNRILESLNPHAQNCVPVY